MITADNKVIEMINASARKIDARVELYEGSLSVDEFNHTLVEVYNSSDALKEFSVERIGEESKFFGFGICQRLNVILIDKDRVIDIPQNSILEVAFGAEDDYTYPCPLFRVEEVSRDETNNDLTITAYDFLYKAGEHRVSEIEEKSYTVREFIYFCANILGLPVKIEVDETEDYAFDLMYIEGANFDGNETIRQALDAVAEATQCIYYVDWDWKLTFKRLDINAQPVITIDKSKYFSLSNKGSKRLATICHATELEDNVSDTRGAGVTQYVRSNPFWELRDDIATLVNHAMNNIAGASINQMNLEWRGNWLVEIGDRIAVITKDDEQIYSYLLNDTIKYNGGLKQITTWNFTEHTGETASNPITIGDAISNTIARVDKINGEVTLRVKETQEGLEQLQGEFDSKVAELTLTADNIIASVESNSIVVNGKLEELEQGSIDTNNKLDGIEQNVALVSSKVAATMTSEEVELLISRTVTSGANAVETTTGFTFNEIGLSVSKSGSEISTTITEDGMTVYKQGEAMLTANNKGVEANNLRSNYIIISNRCRFEKYGADRAGCYWLGGE